MLSESLQLNLRNVLSKTKWNKKSYSFDKNRIFLVLKRETNNHLLKSFMVQIELQYRLIDDSFSISTHTS